MTKIIYTSLKSANPDKRPASVRAKRVQGADGKTVRVLTVDAESPTFGEDMTYAFRQSVRKARREYDQLVKSLNGRATKG